VRIARECVCWGGNGTGDNKRHQRGSTHVVETIGMLCVCVCVCVCVSFCLPALQALPTWVIGSGLWVGGSLQQRVVDVVVLPESVLAIRVSDCVICNSFIQPSSSHCCSQLDYRNDRVNFIWYCDGVLVCACDLYDAHHEWVCAVGGVCSASIVDGIPARLAQCD
jgi:hypothetical protein